MPFRTSPGRSASRSSSLSRPEASISATTRPDRLSMRDDGVCQPHIRVHVLSNALQFVEANQAPRAAYRDRFLFFKAVGVATKEVDEPSVI